MADDKNEKEQPTPQPDTAEPIRGSLDLRRVGVTRNDIISGRIQRAAVDGTKHDVRAQLQADNGGYFNVLARDGEVRCVLAGIEDTRHAMKSTMLGTASVDATAGDDPISVVLFRKAE